MTDVDSEPELPPEKPVFTKELSGPEEILKEGQSVHMDCVVQPINDPSLKVGAITPRILQ